MRRLEAALDSAGDDLGTRFPAGLRTATCSALDHLELARAQPGRISCRCCGSFPSSAAGSWSNRSPGCAATIDSHPPARATTSTRASTKGAASSCSIPISARAATSAPRAACEQHGTASHGIPITRLLRDGLRFDNYLVATACRSCADPHCMFGCPVDSIHRGKHLQIVIEDHCIGCGLCASNCPYGNIFMVPNERGRIEMPDPDRPGKTLHVARPKAVTCDLCDAAGERDTPQPRCVAACPHEAASRMTGDQLLERVIAGSVEGR